MIPRRWYRIWYRTDEPPRTEDTLRIFATDEHSIYKQCAAEGRQVTAIYPELNTEENQLCVGILKTPRASTATTRSTSPT